MTHCWHCQQILQSNPNLMDSVYMFTTQFFRELTNEHMKALKRSDDTTTQSELIYESLRNWTKGDDIFTKDFVIMPICENHHWYSFMIVNTGKLLDWSQSTSLAVSMDMSEYSQQILNDTGMYTLREVNLLKEARKTLAQTAQDCILKCNQQKVKTQMPNCKNLSTTKMEVYRAKSKISLTFPTKDAVAAGVIDY
ncbi:Ulp1 protease [Melampsora larici-populina 98AG31]|uniref:Ulp1 protease n=1 Tax=Melampsora larici-populina (strain 98AG31 / pathotype 3-4-7) TaxID=747676 RepID=F4RF76_MELLP|nr:Ulp1 protease [Melampsora larici-populina 98AG31]EGG08764.1 Ulp1 protease [Melampsora larici-populina 98AG31]